MEGATFDPTPRQRRHHQRVLGGKAELPHLAQPPRVS